MKFVLKELHQPDSFDNDANYIFFKLLTDKCRFFIVVLNSVSYEYYVKIS